MALEPNLSQIIKEALQPHLNEINNSNLSFRQIASKHNENVKQIIGQIYNAISYNNNNVSDILSSIEGSSTQSQQISQEIRNIYSAMTQNNMALNSVLTELKNFNTTNRQNISKQSSLLNNTTMSLSVFSKRFLVSLGNLGKFVSGRKLIGSAAIKAGGAIAVLGGAAAGAAAYVGGSKIQEEYDRVKASARESAEAPGPSEIGVPKTERPLDGGDATPSNIKPKGGSLIPPNLDKDTKESLEKAAAKVNVKPEALAMMIEMESKWNPNTKSPGLGTYRGLTQIGPDTFKEAGGKLGGMTFEQFIRAKPAQQIQAYPDYLKHYKYDEKLKKYGIDMSKLSPSEQAAILQGFQLAPNGKWLAEYAKGNRNVRTTYSKQARALGNTSIAHMENYYRSRVEGAKKQEEDAKRKETPEGQQSVPGPSSDAKSAPTNMDELPDATKNLRVKGSDGKTITLAEMGVTNFTQLSEGRGIGGQAFRGGKGGRYNDPNVTFMAGEIQGIMGDKFDRLTAQNDAYHHLLRYRSKHVEGTKLDFTIKGDRKEYQKQIAILVKEFKNKYGLVEGTHYTIMRNIDHGEGRHVDVGFTASGRKLIEEYRRKQIEDNKRIEEEKRKQQGDGKPAPPPTPETKPTQPPAPEQPKPVQPQQSTQPQPQPTSVPAPTTTQPTTENGGMLRRLDVNVEESGLRGAQLNAAATQSTIYRTTQQTQPQQEQQPQPQSQPQQSQPDVISVSTTPSWSTRTSSNYAALVEYYKYDYKIHTSNVTRLA